MSDVLLNLTQVAEATGVPVSALQKMAHTNFGGVEYTKTGTSEKRPNYRIRLSQLDNVRAAYAEYKTQETVRRSNSQFNRTDRALSAERITRLEKIIELLVYELGSDAIKTIDGAAAG